MGKYFIFSNNKPLSVTNILLFIIATTLIYGTFLSQSTKRQIQIFFKDNLIKVENETVNEAYSCPSSVLSDEYKLFRDKEYQRVLASDEYKRCYKAEMLIDQPGSDWMQERMAQGKCSEKLFNETGAPQKYVIKSCNRIIGVQKYLFLFGRIRIKIGTFMKNEKQ